MPISEAQAKYRKSEKYRAACAARRLKSPEKHRAASARWREKNPEKVKQRNSETRARIIAKSPEVFLLYSARARAIKQNVPCTIGVEDIQIPSVCPVFMVPFIRGDKKWTYSLDKIDPAKGYVPGNVQGISRFANTMKSNASAEELKAFAAWIIFGGQNDRV